MSKYDEPVWHIERAGDSVEIQVRHPDGLTGVGLAVRHSDEPDEWGTPIAVHSADPLVGKTGSWHTWTWYTEITPGMFHCRFSSDTHQSYAEFIRTKPTPIHTTDGLLIGLHDTTGGTWMAENNVPGLCLAHHIVQQSSITIDYTELEMFNIRVLTRLNYGYADGTGTVPHAQDKVAWIEAMAQTIARSRGVAGFIIGNEVNNPAEWPGGYPHPAYRVSPEYYTTLYNTVYQRARELGASAPIAPAALDPYNVVAGQFGQPADPRDWAQFIYNYARGIDFIALHAKTQTNDPNECASYAKFTDWPLQDRYLHLRTVEDQLSWIPARYQDRPIYITELNPQFRAPGQTGWMPDNAEWVRQAISYLATQPLEGAIFYRFDRAGDQAPFGLADKPAILDAIREQAQ